MNECCWYGLVCQEGATHTVGGAIIYAGIRTACRAWCTSRRLGLGREFRCVFGCDAPEGFYHYVGCPALWRIDSQHLLRRHEVSESQSLVQLLLLSPCPSSDCGREWDAAALAIVKAIHHVYCVRCHNASGPDAVQLVTERLGDWSRRRALLQTCLTRCFCLVLVALIETCCKMVSSVLGCMDSICP